jgi:hypothetical protein
MKIASILEVQENAFNFNGLTKTTFQVEEDGGTAYMFTRPENQPGVGMEIEGAFTIDKAGQRKFTKAPSAGFKNFPPPTKNAHPADRQFKADPAKQSSIEWQSAVKSAVEAVKDYYQNRMIGDGDWDFKESLEDYKRDIVNTAITFAAVVGIKPDHTIEKPEPEIPEPEEEEELPPVEVYEDEAEADDGDITAADHIDLSELPF